MTAETLSLNAYYTLFQAYLKNIKKLPQLNLIQAQFEAACQLAVKGLELEREQTNPYNVQTIAGDIAKLTEGIGREIDITYQSKKRQYVLPQIDSLSSLVFGLIYYRHLVNYAQTEYMGPITTYWGVDARSKIQESVVGKKPWNAQQAVVLLDDIKEYCNANEINFEQDIEPHLDNQDPAFIKPICQNLFPESANADLSLPELETQQIEARKLYVDKISSFHNYQSLCHNLEISSEQYLTAKNNYNSQFFLYRWFSMMTNWLIPFNKPLLLLNKTYSEFEASKEALQKVTPSSETFESCYHALKAEILELKENYQQRLHQYLKAKYQTVSENDAETDLLESSLAEKPKIADWKQETTSKPTFLGCGFFEPSMPKLDCKHAAIALGATAAISAASYYVLS